MENRVLKITSKHESVPLKYIHGHFATNHSHINCYLDMTTLKTRQSEAERAAKALVRPYVVTTIVDTILCLDGTQIIGAYLSQELSHAGLASINATRPSTSSPRVRRHQPAIIPGQHPAHGPGQARAHPHRLGDHRHQRGQGHGLRGVLRRHHRRGVLYLQRPGRDRREVRVHSVFTPEDIPDYATYPSHDCPLCKQKQKLDALVNSYGYSKL